MDKAVYLGNITWKDGVFNYEGELPFVDGESGEVAIMKKSYLELLLDSGVALLLFNKIKMRSEQFGKFADSVTYQHPDGTEYKLYLDRHFYTMQPTDMMFLRYESVDRALIEEGLPNETEPEPEEH